MSNKDEFSVNELEPVRNTDVEGTTETPVEDVETSVQLEQTAEQVAQVVEDDEYEGPTAKEIVANSIKIDKTKKRNTIGAIVILVAVGLVLGIILLDAFSNDDNKKPVNKLEEIPVWAEKYDDYFKNNYKNSINTSVSFVDVDFDKEAEMLISYKKDNKLNYDVLDFNKDEKIVKLGEANKAILIYSFTDKEVSWYLDASLDETNLKLINLDKRLNNLPDYETHLVNSDVSIFKSNHFNVSYDLKYTKINFDTYDVDIRTAIKLYDEEKDKVVTITETVIEKYKDF